MDGLRAEKYPRRFAIVGQSPLLWTVMGKAVMRKGTHLPRMAPSCHPPSNNPALDAHDINRPILVQSRPRVTHRLRLKVRWPLLRQVGDARRALRREWVIVPLLLCKIALVQTVRLSVRKAFVWGVTWGNTDPTMASFRIPFSGGFVVKESCG